jgi:CRP-like cAMP-binding protein
MAETTTSIPNISRLKIADQLKESELFKTVELPDLQALVLVMKPVAYAQGDVLFKRGEPGDSMFIIHTGKIRIYSHDTEGNEFTLAEYGESRIFGDFSLLDGQPRSAYAAALEPTELLVLTRDELLAFLPLHPSFGTAMLNHLTNRLRHITRYLNKVTTFGQQLAAGETDKALRGIEDESSNHTDIGGLMTQFKEIAIKVKARAEKLKAD